jgi:hypothetical protein
MVGYEDGSGRLRDYVFGWESQGVRDYMIEVGGVRNYMIEVGGVELPPLIDCMAGQEKTLQQVENILDRTLHIMLPF